MAAQPAEAQAGEAPSGEAKPVEAPPAAVKSARQAGQPPGAPGIGRTQVFQAHDERPHYPDGCTGCGRVLERAGAMAYTGLQAVDLRWGDPVRPGLTLWVVDPRDHETPCAGGYRTRAEAGQGVIDPLLTGIERSGWRQVGLAARMVAWALRCRRSRARIREFLSEWLGLSLSERRIGEENGGQTTFILWLTQRAHILLPLNVVCPQLCGLYN